MPKAVLALLLLALSFTGCSKKQAAADTASEAPAAPKAAAAPRADDAMIRASMDDISKKLQAQQYDAAVGALTAMSGVPKTDAQQAAYMNQLRETQEVLAQRAAQGDQNARQSQMVLGRFMTGR